MSEQSNTLQYIPLNKLIASRLNARRTDRKADIDALAASIAAHGLLQNLTVSPAASDKFEVVAGGRRLAALKSLAKCGTIARDLAVPCQVVSTEDAGERSLAENIQRVAMDAMDEVEAFAALAETGLNVDDIARRFGCGARHVEQRLALARLSPKLKSAYRRGDLSLDAARAFCIVDDHAKQEDVFKALGRHVTHAQSVRHHLMQNAMRANDRMAIYVGLEAYESAGGHVSRDLFNETEAYIDDPALIVRLAHERLDACREDLIAKGWGWVNINLGFNRFEGASHERIQATRRPMTDAERHALAEIDAQAEALDEALEDTDDDDVRWSERDDLAARRYALLEVAQEWDAALMKLAGVVVSLDHAGAPSFAYGVVAKDDVAKVRRLRKEKAANLSDSEADEGHGNGESDQAELPPWEEPISSLPKVLTRELTQTRTCALRWKLSEAPDLALALAVFAMTRRVLGLNPAPGVDLNLHLVSAADHESLEAARAALGDIIPADSAAALDWLLVQPRQTLLEILAVVVSSAIDLSHDGVSRDDARKQKMADQLAGVLDLNMTEHWQPDLVFWSRLSKAHLGDILMTAPGNADLSERQQAAYLKAQLKRPKNELAELVTKTMSGCGWLPDILVTPKPCGAYELTDAGAAIAAE